MVVDYKDGRFFVSPIVGCPGKCAYCYLITRAVNQRPRRNVYLIEHIIESIISNENFIAGKNGSIISVGAWGDIFSSSPNIEFSVYWIKKLLELGNPVQIMSKFTATISNIESICNSIIFPNQLLYSTTITTLKDWNILEKGTTSPKKRLRTLDVFKENGAITNLMIKPFILGYTDYNVTSFVKKIKHHKIDYCVVGVFYWDDEIIKNIRKILPPNSAFNMIINNSIEQVIDCSSNLNMNSFSSKKTDDFIELLKSNKINVFKKSSCVNSNILKVKNISNYYLIDPYSYCLKCGNCN